MTVLNPLIRNRVLLGRCVITLAAQKAFTNLGGTVLPSEYLIRHHMGDWGDLDKDDAQLNNDRMNQKASGQIMSSYQLPDLTIIWIITESDRSVTTILLPGDY